jgi:hypothetical protein
LSLASPKFEAGCETGTQRSSVKKNLTSDQGNWNCDSYRKIGRTNGPPGKAK